MPGLTNSDKKEFLKKDCNDNFNDEFKKAFQKINQSISNEERYEKISSLRSICLYLIEKTANQDEFIKENAQVNQKWTALFLSAQADDKEICRALLNNGADPNLHLGTAPEWGYITFLKRCISFEAWEVLEMFLSEFPELARVTINESENQFNDSPFTAFLRKMIETRQSNPDKYKGRDFVLRMSNLFGQWTLS